MSSNRVSAITNHVLVFLSGYLVRLLKWFFTSKNLKLARRKITPPSRLPILRYQPKPDWIVEEVIRLKAHIPDGSGYTIAHVFNQLHKKRRNMTVSKSYVYTVFKKHSATIITSRKKIKRRKPYSYKKNQLWQLDLTEIKTDNLSLHWA